MANVAFDITRDYQIAQDLLGAQYLVQDGNWYAKSSQVAISIPPNGYKILPKGVSGTYPGAIPLVLGQSGFPMIMPPNSTSLSAAGALVLATALDQTYPNCYMFFPANAVATVSAAGMYFVQMSSATNGAVFQNQYTSGVPAAPAASALIPCTSASSYTQTTGSAVTVASYSVPGSSMGPNGQVRTGCQFNNNNSAGTKTHTMSFGGTAMMTLATTTNQSTPALRHITNRGVTNAQTCQANGSSGVGASAGLNTNLALDTTAAQTLAFQLQLGTATDWAILAWHFAEVWPGA